MKFNYQARTKDGKIQAGILEASSKEAAVDLLQKNNLFVTSLEKSGTAPFYAKKIKFFQGISKKDLVNFSRQLSIMFKSKIPLIEALQVLSGQMDKAIFREKVIDLAEDIEGGSSFSQALSRHPKVFTPFYVSMVKSGEISGTLSESLDYLAEHLEKEYYLYSKLVGAMIYPALIVVVMMIVIFVMMFFVIPDLTSILRETGQELPLVTKIVIAFSDITKKWGIFLLLAFIGLIVFLARYIKTKEGKKNLDRFLLKVPLINSFLKKIYLSRFAENLSTLVAGGIPITQALEITGEVVGNDVYKNIISRVKEEVKKGEQISSVLIQYPDKFPPVFTQMVLVGEKTGTLDRSLLNVVNFYQKEVERGVENLLGILEPVLVIFLGGVVGGIVAAILLPMYRMTAI
ncbi:MAG: type II secretion system F family protein [Candidatus Nealsonbacteria bacterium]